VSRTLVRVLAAASLLLVFAAGSLTARAQEGGAPQLFINQIESADYPAVTAVVTALDASGVPLQGLTPEQFQAQVNATNFTIEDVRTAQDASLPLSVVVVIDVSGSMEGARIAAARDAATQFVNSLGPNDEAAVFAFSGTVNPVIGYTRDKAALAGAIASLQAAGPTALYEAAQSAIAAGRGSMAPRKAVVLLSDGENDAGGSTATLEGSLATARGAGVPVFTIGMGGADETYLRRLADATRGQYVAASSANIADVYAGIASFLRNQYVLTMRAPGEPDGSDAVLQVALTVGGMTARASSPFTRGVAPPPVVPTSAPQESSGDGGGSSALPLILGAGAGIAALAALVLFVAGRARRRERERARRAGKHSDAPVPTPVAVPMLTSDDRRPSGRIIELHTNGTPRAFEVSGVPLTIGSSARCNVRVEPTADVAPEHAMVWARDGKLMLRHVGGARRKTTVDARPVDWLILDDGDEFAVGPYRYRAERLAEGEPTG
jgi:VWFA-related protein